jgi:hypothetical protein
MIFELVKILVCYISTPRSAPQRLTVGPRSHVSSTQRKGRNSGGRSRSRQGCGDGMTTSKLPAVSRTRRAKEVGHGSSEAGSPSKMAAQRRCMAAALPLLAMARPCMKPVGFARSRQSHDLRKRDGKEKEGSCRWNR